MPETQKTSDLIFKLYCFSEQLEPHEVSTGVRRAHTSRNSDDARERSSSETSERRVTTGEENLRRTNHFRWPLQSEEGHSLQIQFGRS